MANEDKKDFNAMLYDSKDMPKFQTITDEKSIEKYGGDRMYFAPPIDYDRIMKRVPYGKVITVGEIRDYFAKQNGADFTEPITAVQNAFPDHQKFDKGNAEDNNPLCQPDAGGIGTYGSPVSEPFGLDFGESIFFF